MSRFLQRLIWFLAPHQEIEMRTRWLLAEQSSLECHAANLAALKAWKDGNSALQDKWTEETDRRLAKHAELLQEWTKRYSHGKT